MFALDLLQYAASFLLLWFGAGIIISAANKFSVKLKLSPFAFSFVFLGILTSTPEFSVGLQAVADKNPEIFIGNLLGGILVIFLVVIPVLAIFGKGISLKHELTNKQLLTTMGVVLLPSMLMLDKRITNPEAVLMVLSYFGLLYIVQRKNGIFNRENEELLNINAYSYKDLLKIIFGIGLVFISSNIIVEKSLLLGDLLNVGVFYIGLLVIAVGTDLPELTLAVRSVLSGKKEIAMGDYMGAAAASTLLFGIFSLLSQGEVITNNNFLISFVFIAVAVSLFYLFSRTNSYISRSSGLVLLGVYIIFVVFELTQ